MRGMDGWMDGLLLNNLFGCWHPLAFARSRSFFFLLYYPYDTSFLPTLSWRLVGVLGKPGRLIRSVKD